MGGRKSVMFTQSSLILGGESDSSAGLNWGISSAALSYYPGLVFTLHLPECSFLGDSHPQ